MNDPKVIIYTNCIPHEIEASELYDPFPKEKTEEKTKGEVEKDST